MHTQPLDLRPILAKILNLEAQKRLSFVIMENQFSVGTAQHLVESKTNLVKDQVLLEHLSRIVDKDLFRQNLRGSDLAMEKLLLHQNYKIRQIKRQV